MLSAFWTLGDEMKFFTCLENSNWPNTCIHTRMGMRAHTHTQHSPFSPINNKQVVVSDSETALLSYSQTYTKACLSAGALASCFPVSNPAASLLCGPAALPSPVHGSPSEI